MTHTSPPHSDTSPPQPDAATLRPDLFDHDVRGVIFDLDGTLIDSAGDILQGMRMTFEQVGLGTLPEDYFPDNMHGTSVGIIRSIMADMGWHGPEDPTALKDLYLANAATLGLSRTQMYEGALAVLQRCAQAGMPMGVCTNKSHAGAVFATRKFDIEGMFRYITGHDTWAEAKPSPLPLLETVRMLGLQPEQCLYFGDTSVDAACAQAAGMRFVLHESGYGDRQLQGMPRHFAFTRWTELLRAESNVSIPATFL